MAKELQVGQRVYPKLSKDKWIIIQKAPNGGYVCQNPITYEQKIFKREEIWSEEEIKRYK